MDRIRGLEQELAEVRLELDRARIVADQASAELETFSYSVSHDLRAPLRAIDGFARILAEEHTGSLDVDGQRMVEVIRTNTKRLGQLMDDLLGLSRIGRRDLTARTMSMTALALAAAKELGAIGLDLNELPPAFGDSALLRQVWIHLIGNAVKYSRNQPAPVIKIRGAVEGEQLIYSVADNGAGFDMRYANKLFGVFQRLHSQREFEGTGVGLALVRRIVDKHGGRAWAEGKVGGGATFWFALPAFKGPGDGA